MADYDLKKLAGQFGNGEEALETQNEIIENYKEKEGEEDAKNLTRHKKLVLAPDQITVYRDALKVLNEKNVRYAVGASFARYAYTSIWRQTKDLDVFLKPEHLREGIDALKAAGFQTEIREEHWLAKAWKNNYYIDLIFGTGHGQIPVDDDTFQGTRRVKLLGVNTNLIPVEEMIASEAYIAGRNRFDGVEIVHLIRSVKGKLDWDRILCRLGDNRELLLWHLILFDFVYPGHDRYLPKQLIEQLFEEVRLNWEDKKNRKTFRGTLLDPFSYNVDIEDWGYRDQRNLDPLVNEEGEPL